MAQTGNVAYSPPPTQRFIPPPTRPPSDGREDRIAGIVVLSLTGVILLIDIALFIYVASLTREAAKDGSFGITADQANTIRGYMAWFALTDLALAIANAVVGLGIMNGRRWAFIAGIVMGIIDVVPSTFGPFGMCFDLGYILAAILIVYSVMRLIGRIGDPPA